MNLAFIPIFKPHTHTIFILRHCTCNVYVNFCAVHVYDVIHFCDSMWSFREEANLCMVLVSFDYMCIPVGNSFIKMEMEFLYLF